MADKKQFSESMESLFKGMEGFVNSKTVIGEPVTLGDAIILPLVNISFGLAAGTGAGGKNNREGCAGGINGKISPSAVLIIQNGTTRLVNISATDNVSKLLDMVPDIVNRFTTGNGVTVSDEEAKDAVK